MSRWFLLSHAGFLPFFLGYCTVPLLFIKMFVITKTRYLYLTHPFSLASLVLVADLGLEILTPEKKTNKVVHLGINS